MMGNNYSINIIWSEDESCFMATSEEVPHVSAFGDTYDEALSEFEDALSLHLESFNEEDLPLAVTLESYSGQFRLRIPRSLHRRLSLVAKRENVSLNTWIMHLLSESISINEVSYNISQEVRHGLLREFAETVPSTYNWSSLVDENAMTDTRQIPIPDAQA